MPGLPSLSQSPPHDKARHTHAQDEARRRPGRRSNLRVLAARPFESPASLHEYLAAQRQLALSPAAVGELLAGLESRALASGTAKNGLGPAKLTPHGAELLRRLTDAVAPTSREVFAGIAPEDLATAHNVLRQIIDRTAGSASDD